MMPTLGAKKKENPSRMDRQITALPQLSNEMQLSIMNKVKNGELSIEDALNQAWKDEEQLFKMQSLAEEEQLPSQYNFSVHKHGRYRWQKRVLQIDFKTKMLCSIEKGIIKRQLPFSIVKNCDDGVGSRFSISFKGHHDYELEATSLEDKHKMMQLVNQIIYGNIYTDPEEGNAETHQQPQASQCLREGVLLLHRGGLASFRWVKYEAQLHPGQLILVPFRLRGTADGEATSSVPVSTVIHLSDGDTSIQKSHSPDTFTLITHKNEYHFKVPVSDQTTAPGDVQREQDDWVNAIDKLCSEWKRKSKGGHMFMETLRHLGIDEDAEDTDTDLESSGGFSGVNTTNNYSPVDYPNLVPASGGGDHDMSQSYPPADYTEPVPKPRSPGKTAVQVVGPDILPFVPSPPSPPSPSHMALTPPPAVPESLGHESESPIVKVPSPPSIPAPPPLPSKFKTSSRKSRTKAFHWDLVGSEKIAKSFWIQESTKRIEIDTSRLYEQFAVKDLGTFGAAEPSNTQHIMLNQKIAHNFNIFLKSFPVQPGELKDKLFIVNEEDGGLSDEHITSLRRYVPTVDDVEMYKSHKGPVTELHIVDQYMMEMCNITYLSTQLDLLLTLRELPIGMNDLQPLINQKIRMCKELYNCRSFVSVLEYLLAIGNYLNENAGKEKAKGFRLSSLTKLSQLRGRDRKFTLLHALVEQIMLHEPCLATFTQELAEFETVPGASIKGLTAEVDVLKNELQKVIQYKKTSKKRNAGAHHANFSKDLKMAIEKYNTDLSALTKTCEEMKKLYSVILVKFGEPADQDSQELFGLICQFIHEFKRTHAEIFAFIIYIGCDDVQRVMLMHLDDRMTVSIL
ncbi:formin-like protein 13 isoform X1 [Thunnus maccoyii]|uniref:formin-like protein 13 isoform X1 n=2 Tax=Thunnus maccoyii TaxID=8240 RepID=UPI001C4C3387|nr:formin-like protein 13 isoform X1 [Thunnus maccoyii]XP_042264120.1 formin-like protein 13 isoform X1 [Thunnus maccoyii]XP_042264121.1 formin-like protein 13 isoform X1 [Thunnus maccoyii]